MNSTIFERFLSNISEVASEGACLWGLGGKQIPACCKVTVRCGCMTFTDLHEVEHVVQRVWVCIERLLVNVRRYFPLFFEKP